MLIMMLLKQTIASIRVQTIGQTQHRIIGQTHSKITTPIITNKTEVAALPLPMPLTKLYRRKPNNI